MKRPVLITMGVFLSACPAFALPADFQETSFVSGLSQPTSMEFAPDGRLFVNEKAGRLRVIKNGSLLATPFITLNVDTNSERGLLGVAFDPNFNVNRFIYLYYTRTTAPIKNRVSRFTASSANPDVVQAGSEVILLDDIPSDAGNHNGGAIHFGLDGKLYIAVGDGGTTHTNAQLLSSLSGKILRINADGSIPSDNPFIFMPGARGEVWAYGLRNPFTFSVDPVSGKIHINDVGENTWEEVNLGVAGANYGWPTCEGLQNTGVGTCTSSAFTYPLSVYNHSVGRAITGGVFYRGNNFPPAYEGVYFFSDYLGAFLKYLDTGNQPVNFGTANSPVDLKVGPDGLLYYAAINTGTIFRISYTGAPTGTLPVILQQPQDQSSPVSQVVTFSVIVAPPPPASYQWQYAPAGIPLFTDLPPVSNGSSYSFLAASTMNGNRYRCVVTNGSGSVISSTASLTVSTAGGSCDLNNDGATDVGDVQQVVNMALGASLCTADLNFDGICTVVDVQRVVNKALGLACVSP